MRLLHLFCSFDKIVPGNSKYYIYHVNNPAIVFKCLLLVCFRQTLVKRYGVIECDPLVLEGLDKTVSSTTSYFVSTVKVYGLLVCIFRLILCFLFSLSFKICALYIYCFVYEVECIWHGSNAILEFIISYGIIFFTLKVEWPFLLQSFATKIK